MRVGNVALMCLAHLCSGLMRRTTRSAGPVRIMHLDAQSFDRTSAVINSLINKSLQLGASLSRSNRAANATTASSALVEIAFSASQKMKITLQNSTCAQAYLSLPAANYSVLDSSLVSKKADQEDTFTFTLSLAELTSSMGPALYTPAVLTMDIQVDTSRTAHGELLMQSSPMLLSPIAAPPSQQPETDTFDLALPVWLVNNSSMGIALAEGGAGGPGVQSPLQSSVRIQLGWNPPSESASEALVVSALVALKFSAALTVAGEAAAVLNFPPMKLLVQQICGLTARSVLASVAPSLSRLLVEDYEKRRATL